MTGHKPAENLPEAEAGQAQAAGRDTPQPQPQRMNRQQRRELARRMEKQMRKAGTLTPGRRLVIPGPEKAAKMSLEAEVRGLKEDVRLIKAYLKRKFPQDWVEVTLGGVVKP